MVTVLMRGGELIVMSADQLRCCSDNGVRNGPGHPYCLRKQPHGGKEKIPIKSQSQNQSQNQSQSQTAAAGDFCNFQVGLQLLSTSHLIILCLALVHAGHIPVNRGVCCQRFKLYYLCPSLDTCTRHRHSEISFFVIVVYALHSHSSLYLITFCC